MKRCYFVIKNVKNFPYEDGVVVYAESIFELINILQNKIFKQNSDTVEMDFDNIKEGMVIDLGEAFEATSDMDIERFDVAYKGLVYNLKKLNFDDENEGYSIN